MLDVRYPETSEQFTAMTDEIMAHEGYASPDAFALGVATVERHGDDHDRVVLDPHFLQPRNYGGSERTAAVYAAALDEPEGLQTGHYLLDNSRRLHDAFVLFRPFFEESGHPNVDALRELRDNLRFLRSNEFPENLKVPILAVVRDWDDSVATVGDAFLRLYALSDRAKVPNSIGLDGIFGALPNTVFSESYGAFTPEKWRELENRMIVRGLDRSVRAIDKFPPMAGFVTPTGVRIADAGRVRLGAHLADGTTVMHEGFSNFNAGTLGAAMVEGRISQGVVVGADTDIGGGASIMGTLSGGGKEKITVGRNTLLGANSGLGISLGDSCIVEAGLYLTAGTRVLLNGQEVKASELSGRSNLLFRRNSQTGVVEALPSEGKVPELNASLHSNQ